MGKAYFALLAAALLIGTAGQRQKPKPAPADARHTILNADLGTVHFSLSIG